MDKFPLICTLAVLFVFFAGACGIAGVQNMKVKEEALCGNAESGYVKSESSFSRSGFSPDTQGVDAEKPLDELLSPRRFDKGDSIIDSTMLKGISVESLRSINSGNEISQKRLTMERKAIEVRGDLFVSF